MCEAELPADGRILHSCVLSGWGIAEMLLGVLRQFEDRARSIYSAVIGHAVKVTCLVHHQTIAEQRSVRGIAIDVSFYPLRRHPVNAASVQSELTCTMIFAGFLVTGE